MCCLTHCVCCRQSVSSDGDVSCLVSARHSTCHSVAYSSRTAANELDGYYKFAVVCVFVVCWISLNCAVLSGLKLTCLD